VDGLLEHGINCNRLSRGFLSTIRRLPVAKPFDRRTSSNKSPRGIIDLFKVENLLVLGFVVIRVRAAGEDAQQSSEFIALIVRW
jgi:hypothetical protein